MEIIKVLWSRWSLGEKIVIISFLVAILTMFMKWMDIGIASQNGLSSYGFLIFVFWIYPLVCVFSQKPMHMIAGMQSALTSVLCAIAYIASKQVNLMGDDVNVSAYGVVIFLLASVALGVGVFFYIKPLKKGNVVEIQLVEENEKPV